MDSWITFFFVASRPGARHGAGRLLQVFKMLLGLGGGVGGGGGGEGGLSFKFKSTLAEIANIYMNTSFSNEYALFFVGTLFLPKKKPPEGTPQG